MAFIYHQATLTPGKLELLNGWLPRQQWFHSRSQVEQLAAYRFDDPDGEVGMEGFLLAAGEQVLHVPLTYRAEPLDGAGQHLVGSTEHSDLGTRWVYDGCADPVWVAAVTGVILTGGTDADQVIVVDGRETTRPSSATVAGSGTPGTPVPEVTEVRLQHDDALTAVTAGALRLTVVRVVGTAVPSGPTLTGRWADAEPAVLASLGI